MARVRMRERSRSGGCAEGAEVVALTTPWEAAESALKAAGDLAGKVVIDATNPVGLGAEGLAMGLVIGHTTSAGEVVAALAKGASVVKCFNTVGAGTVADPSYPGGPATVFLCGDDGAAKATVARLAGEIGLVAVDAGGIASARLIEPLAMLWIHQAFAMGWGMDFTFQVARRASRKSAEAP